MRRILQQLFTSLLLIGLTTAAWAESSEIISEDDLREAAYAGQVDRVEAAFVEAQAAFESGDIPADDMRALVMVLTVSHPKMTELTDEWLRLYPESPFAHVVQAWLYNDIAWNIRGPNIIRKSYPDAINGFYAWHREALAHAAYAYERAPRLIPASDAMIKFANGAGSDIEAFGILKQVMSTDPNMGTLRRALWLTAEGWGGSVKQAERMCQTYAPGLGGALDPVTQCLLYAWSEHHNWSMQGWARSVVADSDDPNLAYYRMYGLMFFWGVHNRKDAEFAFRYLSRKDIIWSKAAETFDLNISERYGYPFLYEAHLRKRIAFTREALELDPYNPDLIAKLNIRIVPDVHRNSLGEPMKKEDWALSPEDKKEMVRRQLVASPYESGHWWRMSEILWHELAPDELLSVDPYLINTVVYSNHSMWELKRLMQKKKDQLELTQETAYGELGGYTLTQDVDNDIICPLIRAQRLYEKVCLATKDEHSSSCEYSKYYQADLDAIWADAVERQICTKERFSPVSWLYYEPVPVENPGDLGG
ncbi:hypothetical protein [Roseovarius sp. 2305UL8-3]|uniref:hypothetical protein n=1 Tax=Roseovarius conchicola TaxID=3121636 RepID=UPI0035298FB2